MAIYKLGDICAVGAGGDLPKDFQKNRDKNHEFPVFGNGTIGSELIGYSSSAKVIERSITVSARGTIGQVAYREEPFTPIVRLIFLVANEIYVLPKYLYYKLKTENFKATGAVQKQLTKPIVSSMKIDIPSIAEQRQIIDIIEPIEALIHNVESVLSSINFFIKNMDSYETFSLSEVAVKIKNKPKNIEQISARVMNKRTPSLISLERRGTYETNSFFVPKGTLLINTIRSYLEKFAIAFEDADANGTLAMFEIKRDWTSILHTLLNDDFWQQAEKLSHGTKMPVLKSNDIFESINFRKTKNEIKDIEKIYLSLSKILIKSSELKEMLINLLVK